MDSAALKERVARSALRQIEDTAFPSRTLLDRAEAALGSSEELGDYADLLVQKVESFRHPSLEVLNRLNRLAGRLEQLEQHRHA